MNFSRSQFGNLGISSTYLPAEESPIKEHHDALAVWNDKRGDRWAPTWDEVEITDFPPRLIQYIAITDLTAEPLTSVYRYWGSKLTDCYGSDYTGLSPADVPPKTIGVSNQSGCATIIRERTPHFQLREYENHKGMIGRAMILRVPLSNEGEYVNHSIAFNYYEPAVPGQKLSEFFDRIFAELPRY